MARVILFLGRVLTYVRQVYSFFAYFSFSRSLPLHGRHDFTTQLEDVFSLCVIAYCVDTAHAEE
jgi:hypothetical protein